MAVASDFDLITEKIRRAREHLKLFEDEAGAYFKECGPAMDIKVNPQMTEMFLCLTIEKEPPPRLSVIIGDCVHNARSALDNIICALVRIEKPQSTCNGRQYPAFTDPKEYEAAIKKGILKGVPEKALRLIETLHPCSKPAPPIPATLHAVAILNALSNRDKHLAPHLTAAYSRKTTFSAQLPQGPWILQLTGSLYSNTNMKIQFQPGLLKYSDRLKSNSTLNIQFKDRSMFGDEPVLNLLSFCVDFVENGIVASLKPFLDE